MLHWTSWSQELALIEGGNTLSATVHLNLLSASQDLILESQEELAQLTGVEAKTSFRLLLENIKMLGKAFLCNIQFS